MALKEIFPEGVDLYDPDDVNHWRKMIYEDAQKAFSESFPKVYGGVQLEVSDLEYVDPEDFNIQEEQSALLEDKTLFRRLRGVLTLKDNTTGETLDSKRKVLMRVPYMTRRGTFINSGTDYSPIRQSRLLPGVYTRKKKNAEIESQFNIEQGTGPGYRIGFDPKSAIFKLNMGQASLRLYSVLSELGVPDDEMRNAWGDEIFEINKRANDARTFDKLYNKFMGRAGDETLPKEERRKQLLEKIQKGRVSKNVLERTLPSFFQK